MKKLVGLYSVLLLAVGTMPAVACSLQEPSTDPAGGEVTESEPQDGPADPDTFPDVVAKVNEAEINKQDLVKMAQAARVQQQGGQGHDTIDFYRSVLDDLVSAELLFQESQAKGHLAVGSEVDKEFGTISARFPAEGELEQALLAQGLSQEKLRESITRNLSIQKLLDAEIISGVEITEEKKRAFYDENRDRMQQPEQVRVSHILVGADQSATPQERQQAREKSAQLQDRIKAGEDFAVLARENSDDPGSKDSEGALPWLGRGETVPPFEEAAFALSSGEISEVVETPFGFHIIRLDDRRAGRSIPYAEAEERIGQLLRQEGIQEKLQNTIDTLKEKAEVTVFI